MLDDWFWYLMCACYFVGGSTIGWGFNELKHKKRNNGKRTGTGRWDYRDRHLGDDGEYK